MQWTVDIFPDTAASIATFLSVCFVLVKLFW
jgi:hypothetical protein